MKNLLKHFSICLLICLCLSTIYVPNMYAADEGKPCGLACKYCSQFNTYLYEHVRDDDSTFNNRGDSGHEVPYFDDVRCKNKECEYYNKHVHGFNHHVELEPHSINASHSGNSVKVTCSGCKFKETLDHKAYIKKYGNFIKHLTPRFSQVDLQSHTMYNYDLYRCDIPGCQETAEKLVYKALKKHSWHTHQKHLPARHQTEIWQECGDCHKTKNRHYVNDSSVQ